MNTDLSNTFNNFADQFVFVPRFLKSAQLHPVWNFLSSKHAEPKQWKDQGHFCVPLQVKLWWLQYANWISCRDAVMLLGMSQQW